MRKLLILFSVIFCSLYVQAAENEGREFTTSDPNVRRFVSSNPLNHLTYQVLRTAESRKDIKLFNEVNSLWAGLRHKDVDEKEAKITLSRILYAYKDQSSITRRHLEMAETLGIYEKNIWEKSNLRFGPIITGAFKILAVAGITLTFVVTPAAAVVMSAMPQGTYKESCKDIDVKKITTTDDTIRGDWTVLEAMCAYDRADHGLKSNSIILPKGGPCGYIHNNNGTLVASDSPYLSVGYHTPTTQTVCPELQGSFTKTCGRVTSLPYSSTDTRIPTGTVCKYTIEDCKKRDRPAYDTKTNTLYISTAAVKCQGARLENCDGTLVGREAGESDSQCDYSGHSKHKSEL